MGAAFFVSIASFAHPDVTTQPGLLFYLSGENGTTADVAFSGTHKPNYEKEITVVSDGAQGAALRCGDMQLLSYWAPGNIYAQRGTVSFFWRSREPVGPTEFVLFRVAYADHSSWDMVWLRIDYNGHGFDAFVTDANLARTRVSVTLDPFPKPDKWVHIALSWDETSGIRFYVDGKLAATTAATARFDAALDQFGPHSRIIAPVNVQSDYNFARGGDIDELRIYDRMLSDENIAQLAKNTTPANIPAATRTLASAGFRNEWLYRYGWDRASDAPPTFSGDRISVRKVEIHEAYDLKRWWWKATDGIRETTWPGVYNRSRLPGRTDYFPLPDWDCYVDSGKAVTFSLPDEPWNHLEISGQAGGAVSLLKSTASNEAPADALLFTRPRSAERTVHHLDRPVFGQKVRFNSQEQEEPIGEFAAYYVAADAEPTGTAKRAYRLTPIPVEAKSLEPLTRFIDGRFASDERSTLFAVPATTPRKTGAPVAPAMPIVHVLLPIEATDPSFQLEKVDGGLDGIAVDLPALKIQPTHGELIALNIQVKDPLWPMRNMLDFTFSVKPGESKKLWLDLRDRILPPGKGLYLTIASASPEFGPQSLAEAEVRLVFKTKAAARAEHEFDRFTQARDAFAMLIEEHAHDPRLNLWNRFEGDINDVMRVNPDHVLARAYHDYAVKREVAPRSLPAPPAGVPLWAFRQVDLLKRINNFVTWWIDHRQVPYGDFGGGISDDVDLTNVWPGVALMGHEPEKLTASVHALLEAAYKNGMFTNGLPTLQSDYLHSYEEGINCLAQTLLLEFGNPKQLERTMETTRGVLGLTGVNAAGHSHFRSCYFSATKIAEDGPWGTSRGNSYLILQPSQFLVNFNGNPQAKNSMVELAASLLAHRKKNASGNYELPGMIYYATDAEAPLKRHPFFPWPLFWTAYQWTGDEKFLEPIFDQGLPVTLGISPNILDWLDRRKEWSPKALTTIPSIADKTARQNYLTALWASEYRAPCPNHFLWQATGDKKYLEEMYDLQIAESAQTEFMNTEGSLWTDRVGVPFADVQRERLGGIALVRNATVTGNVVSWKFRAPARPESVAILIPNATPTSFKVIVHNLESLPVRAEMMGWNIDPGVWEITQGIDTKNTDVADSITETRTAAFERSRTLDFTFAPQATTVLTLTLKKPGTPYWQRPDLGIGTDDIQVEGRELRVRVHSLGSVPSQPVEIVLRDSVGKVLDTATVPAIAAPLDLYPKTTDVRLTVTEGTTSEGCCIEIDPTRAAEEITLLNNTVKI